MTELLLGLAILLSLACLALLLVLLGRLRQSDSAGLLVRLDAFEKGQEKLERAVREEIAKNRSESLAAAKQQREEASQSLLQFSDNVFKGVGELTRLQKTQLEAFAAQLAKLIESNEKKMEAVRATVEAKLKEIQTDNAARLEQMRATVDEKLQGTLDKRLGESFKQVCERLEQVHNGLGEMRTLATGVGDLKKVLTNVKTRGTWGEIQLGALLEQILTADQYETNVITRQDGREPVEFAIRLPGREGEDAGVVRLPIDAKFPLEDYQRLQDAQDAGNLEAADAAGKQLEARVKLCARDIRDKYLDPPHTTDFALMYLPIEGLYAEVIRRAGLVETLQRDHRVVVAGPTTLAALLNSLQMGFRTLAIEKRSSEVWKLLAAVKTEFGKFGDILERVHKQIQTAGNTIDTAARKTRTIERKLKGVEALPIDETAALLPAEDMLPDDTEAADA